MEILRYFNYGQQPTDIEKKLDLDGFWIRIRPFGKKTRPDPKPWGAMTNWDFFSSVNARFSFRYVPIHLVHFFSKVKLDVRF